jgi:hypothetical protein
MSSTIKTQFKRTLVYDVVKYFRLRKQQRAIRAQQDQEIRDWQARGKPDPVPHIVKQRTIRAYAKRYSLEILLETGTYLGDMVEAMKGDFTTVLSIELDQKLYGRARQRFADHPHISIVQGDSGKLIAEILAAIDRPCLFWLDGHYSGDITTRAGIDTPIVEELRHIMSHPVAGHVILIDDGRLFVGKDGYPTMNELRSMIHERHPDWIIEFEDDIIRIVGPGNLL